MTTDSTTLPPVAETLPKHYWDVIKRLQYHPHWSSVNGTSLRVLLALIRYVTHDKARASAYPSVARLAKDTGNAPRSVKRALSKLRALRFITLERRRKTKERFHRGVGRYSINLPEKPVPTAEEVERMKEDQLDGQWG